MFKKRLAMQFASLAWFALFCCKMLQNNSKKVEKFQNLLSGFYNSFVIVKTSQTVIIKWTKQWTRILEMFNDGQSYLEHFSRKFLIFVSPRKYREMTPK